MVLRYRTVQKASCTLIVLAIVLWQHPSLARDAGSVTGVVFLDKNANGVRDHDEPGFSGVAVTLFGKRSDGKPFFLATQTDSQGRFAFPGALIGQDSNFTVSTGGAPLAAKLPTTYRPERTFYTATDGNDRNSGTREQPFRNIGRAVPQLQAGDVLYIRQGEYREYITSMNSPLGSGSGWDRPIVVAGMPGETVVIRPPDRESRDPLISLAFPRQQYLVFDNLILDAEATSMPLRAQASDAKDSPPNHIRVINCELKNARGSGAVIDGEGHQVVHCRIHDNGRSLEDHGLRISGGHNLVQGCDIYCNPGWGILLDGGPQRMASNNVIRGNRVHDNDPRRQGSAGIALFSGSKNLVYDNVVWRNTFGITVNNQGCEQQILNNTVYGNRAPGIAIGTDEETHGNVVRNNITIENPDPNLHRGSETTVYDHNFIAGKPHFRDPQADDFHLLPDSLAIDAGVTIEEIRSDHDGIPRPQGKGYDLGAYEYSEDAFVPTTRSYSTIFVSGQSYPVLIGFATKAKK